MARGPAALSGQRRDASTAAGAPRRALLGALVFAGAFRWRRTTGADAAPASAGSIVIGTTPVRLLVDDRPPPGVTYVHLHENETTAAEAAARAFRSSGGRLVRLRAQGTRLITFRAGARRSTFDPNRMFTPTGVGRTLDRYGANTPRARAEVAAFAQRVLAAITAPAPRLVIAPHDNAGRAYSFDSYRAGGGLARAAARIHAGGGDPTEFCLVTDASVFAALERHPLNVVLQDPLHVEDDGSLAVYCARQGLRYVNVEARHGHLARQVALLELVRRVAA